ncbi:nitrogen permease regulator 2 [Mytilinidion resinicola]|uniref:Nitrogen permease regulator 2 n=1 Tax=Mytilinidion resinicola TaxID=574789 RepID=A0A6A6YKH3_9PEZI|nr:nitrogen permease regulator 2 [Mytilinidion resinicola]KAF2808377.1 nitrogen permease regulator 2 [Mytilinidion resinicola]
MPTRMIKSIFFTRFHPEKGSRVLHQVPEGSITPSASPSALKQPLFHFPSVSDYIIPRQEFCDRLVTTCTNRCRVVGYPVCIKGEGRYNRNEFIFNFALVLDEDAADWGSYASVVRKLGRLLRALEEQGGFLSREEDPRMFEDDEDDGLGWKEQGQTESQTDDDEEREYTHFNTWKSKPSGNGGKVYALCEMILEDLNNYCECMIPIDDSNTINLKLFPTHLPPAPIFAWHVPLLTIDLSSFSSTTISSDLTLTRILPYIDGTRSVSHLSQLADTDLSLTRKAVQHLVYYGCVILLDIFHFNAIYAPTAEIYDFITDQSLQEECARYVRIPHISLAHGARHERKTLAARNVLAEDGGNEAAAVDADRYRVPKEHLVKLYTSLKQGLTLRNWVLENFELLTCVDVRRFITFGVIKGFLYRVHKYAIATSSGVAGFEEERRREVLVKPHEGEGVAYGSDVSRELPLARYLDGLHSFDEICTELRMNEKDVLERVKGFGEVQIIHR